MSAPSDVRPTLHALRRSHNLTLSELARLTGIPVRRLAEIEYENHRLEPAERKALAAIFGAEAHAVAHGIDLPTIYPEPPARISGRGSRATKWTATAAAVLSLCLSTPLPLHAAGSAAATSLERQPAVAAAAQRWWVASPGLNLRVGPGTSNRVVKVLVQGTEVRLQNETRHVGESLWVKVLAGRHQGWVNQYYLTPDRPAATLPAAHLNDSSEEVASPGLNLRAGPGMTNPVIRVLRQGTEVRFRNDPQRVGQSVWVNVLVGPHRGWVNRYYLTSGPSTGQEHATEDVGTQPALSTATTDLGAMRTHTKSASWAPIACPVLSPGRQIVMTQGYGVGTHAPAATWGAIDLAPLGGAAAAVETVIVAAHAGTVDVAFDTWPAGNHVWVNGADGWRTGYSHLQAIFVETGQYVEAGQPLGQMGSTGASTGPHLDFQVWRNGVNVDPTSMVDCR